jgi:hypothetical protein
MSNITEITMEDMPFHLEIALATKSSIIFHGPPGVGKSSGIFDFCQRKFDQGLFKSNKPIEIRLGQHDTTDFKFPDVQKRPNQESVLHWIVAEIFPRADRDGENGVLFLDEISSAPPSLQVIAYALLLDRRIPSTSYELPPGWLVVGAGNRDEDQAVTHRLSSALCNRVNHFSIKPDLGAFLKWAHANSIHPSVIQFLEEHPSHLYSYSRGDKAYPTPRSWAFASKALQALQSIQPPPTTKQVTEQMTSWLGNQVGQEFSVFLQHLQKLPKAEDILLNKVPLPTDPGTVLALNISIAAAVKKAPAKLAKAFLSLLLNNMNEELGADCLRRLLLDGRNNSDLLGALQREKALWSQVTTRYKAALAALAL